MSRYEYRPPGWPSHYSFAVGWDPATETYFAQVMDYSISRDDDCVIAWIGALKPHYRDIDEMLRAVNESIRDRLPEVTLTEGKRARLKKDFRIDMDGGAPHSTFPKSTALPPLYLLQSAERCPHCADVTPVYALAATGLQDAEEKDVYDGFVVLTAIEHLSRSLIRLLHRRCPTWRLDQEDPSEPPYLMNHCRCGERLSDSYIHGDAGAAFFPTSEQQCRDIKRFPLPIDEEVMIVCSWTLGGLDDMLDSIRTEPW